MMNYIDVTVIIVSWNTRDILKDCLVSVYKQTKDIIFEVIVVDNASTDGSALMVQNDFPQVILIDNSENRGFAAANNQGMHIAKGRYVLLLNSDTVILGGAIQKTLRFADHHPKVAVVGICNNDGNGKLIKNCFQFASVQNLLISTVGFHRIFPMSRLFGRERMTWWNFQSVREVDAVAGCYMLVRRKAIGSVGMMDERFFMYGEEMDWCWRFKLAGWKTLYYPDAQIIHYGGMSAVQNPMGMRLEQQKSFLYFIEKRQGQSARLFARFLLTVSAIVRIGYWGGSWLIGDAKERADSFRKLREIFVSCFGV